MNAEAPGKLIENYQGHPYGLTAYGKAQREGEDPECQGGCGPGRSEENDDGKDDNLRDEEKKEQKMKKKR